MLADPATKKGAAEIAKALTSFDTDALVRLVGLYSTRQLPGDNELLKLTRTELRMREDRRLVKLKAQGILPLDYGEGKK